MKELEELRLEINHIDKQIVNLFERRMDFVSQVGKIKIENNISILDSTREEEVIKKNIEHLDNKSLSSYLEELYIKIMDLSKDYQNDKLENKNNKG